MAEHEVDGMVVGEHLPPPPVPQNMNFSVHLRDCHYEVQGVTASGFTNGFLVLMDGDGDQWSFNADSIVLFTMSPSDE